jgi:hypothetical protein
VADPSTRVISIWPYPYTGTPYQFKIVADDQIAGNKRAIERSYEDANATTPGRRKRVEFEVWGPVGASLQSTAGGLGIDFTRNMETRWERKLTSGVKQTTLDLTTDDPPGEGAYFGTAYFGSSYFSSAGVGVGAADVVVFAEQDSYLFACRGRLLTQVNMTTTPWTVVSTTVLDAAIRDADHWRGTVKIALGPTAPMVRIAGANSSGPTLVNVTATSPNESVYASAIKTGSDRAWYINANQSQTTYNYAGYTLDDFVNLASPFQVGDPDTGTTGIGPFGPFTMFGTEDGIYSFTDQGKPVALSRALTSVHSTLNGYQFADPGWNWNYYTAITGLRANGSGADNPVGIGERMRGFTGHDGQPHALYQVRGELPVAYHTSSDTYYGYRGTFGPATGGTGQPMLWPWFYSASGDTHAIYSSTTGVPNTSGIWLIRGEGTNLTYSLIAADGRDDLYPSYQYSVAGGTAYLTTLDENPNLLKVLRLARFRTRSMASGDSYTVAFAFDPNPTDPVGATYVSLDAVTTNGNHTIVPDNGTATGQGNPSPTVGISGFSMKPRITQVALGSGSSTSPPEIIGTLDVEYDERPELFERVNVAIDMTGTAYSDNKVWDLFAELSSQQTAQPFRIQYPDDMPPGVSSASGGGQKYAMVSNVSRRTDIKAGDIEAFNLVIDTWPQESVL